MLYELPPFQSVVLRYAQSAAQHSKSVVDMIKNKLAADIELRKKLLLENLQDREVEPLVGLARAFR